MAYIKYFSLKFRLKFCSGTGSRSTSLPQIYDRSIVDLPQIYHRSIVDLRRFARDSHIDSQIRTLRSYVDSHGVYICTSRLGSIPFSLKNFHILRFPFSLLYGKKPIGQSIGLFCFSEIIFISFLNRLIFSNLKF